MFIWYRKILRGCIAVSLIMGFSGSFSLISVAHGDAIPSFDTNKPIPDLVLDHVPGELLIKTQDGNVSTLRVPESMEASALASMTNAKGIAVAEPNYRYHAASIPIEPNDTLFGSQLYLEQIDTKGAWRYTTGSKKITVAVLDTGVDIDHPDLKENIWINSGEVPGDGIDNDKNGYIDDINGWDFINDIPDPNPKFSDGFSESAIQHGTLIAGTIAAEGNNGIGVAGISWHSRIMPLRVLNNRGDGDALTVAEAIDYAIAKKADILNLSFVGEADSSFLKAAIERAHNAGLIIVAASGNDEAHRKGVNLDETPRYPVCYDLNDNAVIGVGSTDPLGKKANFSHFGSCIDVMAPGFNFFTTQVVSYERQGFDTFYGDGWSGTSLSTGVISGAFALLKSIDSRLGSAEAFTSIKKTCEPIDLLNPTLISRLGCGKINVMRALELAVDSARVSTTSVELSRQITAAIAYTGADGSQPLKFSDAEGSILKELYPFAPYKIGYSIAYSGKDRGMFVVGASAPGGPHVRMYDRTLTLKNQFFAYDKQFKGGVSVAIGDVDGDGEEDIITVPGPGGGPHVKIFDLYGNLKDHFFAYDRGSRFGLRVALADTDNDAIDEIIVTPAHDNVSDVRIFSARGVLKGQFFAQPKSVKGSSSLAAGDIDGDGTAEIITAPFEGSGTPTIKIFSAQGVLKRTITAFNPSFKGGVVVSLVDLNGDGKMEIVAAPARAGGPHLRIFSYEGKLLSQFFGFANTYQKGLILGGISSIEL